MHELALILCIFAAAVLYSSVGHGGASAYLAAMALFSVAPEAMRPASLTLNIFVATIGLVQFCRAGRFSWSILWPFALASVPAAFIGGAIKLPGSAYRIVVGVVLLVAAARLFWKPVADTAKPIPLPVALVCGAAIGLFPVSRERAAASSWARFCSSWAGRKPSYRPASLPPSFW
jgi:uncharacterized protein